jgi:hypothetical protein
MDVIFVKYKIAAIGDIHWGALDAEKQWSELSFLFDYLQSAKINLLVICGDYFDHKLLLNSQASVMSIDFMHKLIKIAKKKKFIIRVIVGTRSHDYDQLEVFAPMEDDTFKIFRTTTMEETLPQLQCLYAPDETMSNEKYFNTYPEVLTNTYDIMFFHGNFDVVAGNLIMDSNQLDNVVYEYEVFSQLANIMIGGHWHDADQYGRLYYTRSMNRWKFGEDNTKGFIECIYDTDADTYTVSRISNNDTDAYRTFLVDTSLFSSVDEYSNLITNIDDAMSKDSSMHVRIKVEVTNDSPCNDTFLDNLRIKYQNNRLVRIVIENKFVKQQKKKKREAINDAKDAYSFLFNGNLSIIDKIKEYVKVTKDIELSDEELKEILSKYLH